MTLPTKTLFFFSYVVKIKRHQRTCKKKKDHVAEQKNKNQNKSVIEKTQYNPNNLQMGGPLLLADIETYLKAKNYKSWKIYITSSKTIINHYEAWFSDEEKVWKADSLLWALESGSHFPLVDSLLSEIPDAKKHKALINAYKVINSFIHSLPKLTWSCLIADLTIVFFGYNVFESILKDISVF